MNRFKQELRADGVDESIMPDFKSEKSPMEQLLELRLPVMMAGVYQEVPVNFVDVFPEDCAMNKIIFLN